MARFAVIGAGIAGLAAAWELERAGVDVVVFEAGPTAGGKLQSSPVPGLAFPLDDGADAFLARVPEALELCAELGIDDLVHPATGQAYVYARGALRPLPKGQLLGIPTDLDELATTGLLSDAGMAAALADVEADWAPPTHDLSVGDLVRTRLGDEVCDHLVEPLLGGINGGEADGLSAAATAPQIWGCAMKGGSIVRAAAQVKATAASDAPVFATPIEGMASLADRLVDALRAEIRLGAAVSTVERTGTGVTIDGEAFDGVVIATPARGAAPLLDGPAPDAALALAGIDFASVVMVTIVADAASVDHPLDGSGFVAARTAGTSITACSWGSSKWAHWNDGDHVVFRVSLGHDADPTEWCALDDDRLLTTALADLRTTMGVDIAPARGLVGHRVGRWPHSFPQYRPGHLELVAGIHATAAAAGPIALAGASLGGIGVPACIRQGREAARKLLA